MRGWLRSGIDRIAINEIVAWLERDPINKKDFIFPDLNEEFLNLHARHNDGFYVLFQRFAQLRPEGMLGPVPSWRIRLWYGGRYQTDGKSMTYDFLPGRVFMES